MKPVWRITSNESIAAIALYTEPKGMVVTAEKFTDAADERKKYPFCREPLRASLGYKCIPYKKKYTIVLIEGG